MSYMLSGGYATSEKVKQIQAPTLVLWGAQVGPGMPARADGRDDGLHARTGERTRPNRSKPSPTQDTQQPQLKH